MVVRSDWMCFRRLLILLSLSATITTATAQDAAKGRTPESGWTFEEAQSQLTMYPKDVFLQYVALKLGQRDGFDATELLRLNDPSRRQIAAERRENVDGAKAGDGAAHVVIGHHRLHGGRDLGEIVALPVG